MNRVRPLIVPLALLTLALVIYHGRIREMADFGVYHRAAVRAIHAEPLYNANDGHYQFKYLPAFALAMAPFALLEREGAQGAWFALSFAWMIALLRWSVYGLPERRLGVSALTWLAVLFMAKFYGHELVLGQSNLLLAVVIVAGLLAFQVELPVAGAVLVAVAVFVKPYTLLLLPWIVLTQGRRATLAAFGVLAAGLLLPALVYGWQGNVDLLVAWYRATTTSTEALLAGGDSISVAAMWAKWLGIGTAATVLALISAATLLGAAVFVWSRRSTVGEPDYLEVALLMLCMPLLSPQGWDYVLLLATPAVVCLIDRWKEIERGWRFSIAAALVCLGLSYYDVMGRALYERFMALSVVSVAALVLAAGLAHLRMRRLA